MLDQETEPFFDRREERGLFVDMLDGAVTHRVLAIGDRTNTGKTSLLQALMRECADRGIPVAIVSPGELSEPHAVELARLIRDQLVGWVPFDTFDGMEFARASSDIDALREYSTGPQVRMDLRGADFTDARQPMIAEHQTIINQPHGSVVLPHPKPQSLNPQQDRWAREVCMQAFADDLRRAAAVHSVALLLDGYEGYTTEVQKWFERFLAQQIIAHREGPPQSLALAVAGQTLPQFNRWDSDRVARLVARRVLRPWPIEDFAEALKQFGFRHEESDIPALYDMIGHHAPKEVIGMIQLAVRRQQPRP